MPLLDSQRERIQDDLRGVVSGEVLLDDISRQMFASDGSLHEICPLGVVRPRSTADVVACVEYAAEKEISIHARGSGTSTVGASLGRGLVLDFSHSMRRVLSTEQDAVRAQAGTVHGRLNAHLANFGRFTPPAPRHAGLTHRGQRTVASVVAIESSGSHWLKHGPAGRHVASIQVVLADGEAMEFGRESLSEIDATASPRKREILRRLGRLLSDNAGRLARHKPGSVLSRCGYRLHEVLRDGMLDMPRLMSGSEGTLALFTELTLATYPLPAYRGVILLLFSRMETACRAVGPVLEHRPSACSFVDRRHLSLAREADIHFDVTIPPEVAAVMLVELEAPDPFTLHDRQRELIDDLCVRRGLAATHRRAEDAREVDLFWQLVEPVRPSGSTEGGPAHPAPPPIDVATSPERLGELVVSVQNVLKRHDVVATLLCHVGQGQLDVRPLLNMARPEDVRRMRRLAEVLHETVEDAGGVMGPEHGCGLSRTALLKRQAPNEYDLFVEVKRIFDPDNRLNPGKIVGNDSRLSQRDLRPIAIARPATEDEAGLRDVLEAQLDWQADRIVGAAVSCDGCGQCQTHSPQVRVCPMFRIHPSEEASPRSKANVARGIITGRLELASLTSDRFMQLARLCIHCHACAFECPAKVDVPRLMLEGKGAYIAAHGLTLTDRVLTQLERFSRHAAKIAPVVNWALANRPMRWLLEKTIGIPQGRKLPRVAARGFLRRAARERLTRLEPIQGDRVAYFADTYANYHDPELAEAAVAVLRHNDIAVHVPPNQEAGGMGAIASGDLDHARWLARRNVEVLADAVRQGYHVVATEPSAAVCLIREYPYLLGDDQTDAQLIAQNSSELCTYLWRRHAQGKLRLDFQPVPYHVGYHAPCRLKLLQVGLPGMNLLRLIPELRVEHCQEGCSGMAGTFGLSRENYRASLRIGFPLISRLRDHRIQAGTTECSACKIQMEHGTTKPTVHPIKILALAYGLSPKLADRLSTPGRELTVT